MQTKDVPWYLKYNSAYSAQKANTQNMPAQNKGERGMQSDSEYCKQS